jgi:hypothetical protein
MHSALPRATRALLAAAVLAAGGCKDFLEVENPNVIDISAIDPVADAPTLANSAQQNFAVAYGWLSMYSAWLVGEALVSETFPTRNEFGTRTVQQSNGSLNTDVWQPLSLAAASTNIVLKLDLPTPDRNLNRARAALWRGFSFVFMAEMFCRGTVESGAELSTAAMLDSAVAHFTTANTIGRAESSAEGLRLANAALVGRARAHLQAGRKAQAAADADLVPAGFVFNLAYIDDLGNRTRLGNRLWQFTLDRGSISVAPFFRTNDTRVPYQLPGQHNLVAQDPAAGAFVIQQKFASFGAPVRIASRSRPTTSRRRRRGPWPTSWRSSTPAGRRAARPPTTGPTDANSVLTELMTQRGYDFYLEGKRLGDFRRNPANVLGVPVTGEAYFKPGFSPIGNATCFPLPIQEVDNNPNLRPTG